MLTGKSVTPRAQAIDRTGQISFSGLCGTSSETSTEQCCILLYQPFLNFSQEGTLAEVNLDFVVSPLIIRGRKKPTMTCVYC